MSIYRHTAATRHVVRVAKRMAAHLDEQSWRKAAHTNPHLQAWQALSMDDILATRQVLSNHWATRYFWWIALAFIVTGFGVAFALTGSAFSTGWGLLGVFGGFLTWGVYYIEGYRLNVALPRYHLEPSSREAFLCVTALEFTQAYDCIRTYRDAIVSAGRELTVLDLNHIRKWGYEEKERLQLEVARERTKKACQALHGLSPT
jgi:hypothetical protein